ncbi:hypothetical protein [Leifsonia sp. LS1]|uniref:hypothetical protein n=1 Tax=Leifsonia sp. LS1 TaxID=2828483 RepID=UPI001CFDA24C|nr:hypothetical protein [Leifsonia sp. LS1]
MAVVGGGGLSLKRLGRFTDGWILQAENPAFRSMPSMVVREWWPSVSTDNVDEGAETLLGGVAQDAGEHARHHVENEAGEPARGGLLGAA